MNGLICDSSHDYYFIEAIYIVNKLGQAVAKPPICIHLKMLVPHVYNILSVCIFMFIRTVILN